MKKQKQKRRICRKFWHDFFISISFIIEREKEIVTSGHWDKKKKIMRRFPQGMHVSNNVVADLLALVDFKKNKLHKSTLLKHSHIFRGDQ